MISIEKRKKSDKKSGAFLTRCAAGVRRVAAGLFAFAALATLAAPNAEAQNVTGKPTIPGAAQAAITSNDRANPAPTGSRSDPIFESARTDGTDIVLTFSEDIFLSPLVNYVKEVYNVPFDYFVRAVFDVTINGHQSSLLDGYGLSGSKLTLFSAYPMFSDDEVRIAYDNIFAQNSGGIFVDADGNTVPFFSYATVQNNEGAGSSVLTDGLVLDTGGTDPTEIAIEEDNTGTFTITLASEPSDTVTVKNSAFIAVRVSPDEFTFTPDNWDEPQTVTISTTGDSDSIDAWAVVFSFIDGDANSFRFVKVLIEDNEEELVVSGDESVEYAENGTSSVASYSVSDAGGETVSWRLFREDSDDFTISAAGELAFITPPDYDNPADADRDNVYRIAVEASNGQGTGVLLDVRITVTEAQAVYVTITETLSVAEDAGNAQLTLELSEAHSDPVTVDWTTSDGTATGGSDYVADNGTVNFAANETQKTIDVAITDDALDENDETFTVTLSNPSNAEPGTATTTTVTIVDNNPTPTVTLSLSDASIGENGGVATVTASLSGASSAPTTVTVSTAESADYSLSTNKVLTIPAEQETSTGTVTVTAIDNKVDAADKTVSVKGVASNAVGATDPADIALTIEDDDVRGVTIAPTTLTITEGASQTYEVTLDTQPTGDVTVTPSLATGSDADVTLASSAALTFTSSDWNEAQEVTVNAAEDNDTAHGEATIEHVVGGADYAAVTASDVTATEADNDTPGVAISPTTLPIAEGTSQTYEVVLNTQPTGDVTVTPSLATGSDEDVTLASAEALTFTTSDWNMAQTVTVNAAEDNDTAHGEATIEHAVAGADYAGVTASEVTVTEADNDTPGVTIAPTTLTITEGASQTYEVALDTQPTGDVTVTPSLATGSDEDVTLASSTALTFTSSDWNTPQTVTVNAAEDSDTANGEATIEHVVAGAEYAGVTASDVAATEADNDTPGVAISPTTLTIAEGAGKTYEVALNTQPTGDVTVTPSLATGSDADVTLASSASLTFTSSDWNTAQTVTVNAAEDNDTANGVATIEHAVAGADYAGVTASNVTVTEADNDTPGTTPQAPENLQTITGSAQVTLHWDAPGNDGGAGITGYEYRHKESGGAFIAWTDIPESGPGEANARSYTVTGLTNGLEYVFHVRAVNEHGGGLPEEITVMLPPVTNTETRELPTEVALLGNYPNPFNPETTIRYTLPQASEARLAVYDLLGHEVAVLVDASKPAGDHAVRFNAADLPSGLYVYRLQATGKIVTRSMMLVK